MIDIYKLKLTLLQQEILRLLFIKTGTTLNAHQIAKALGVSMPAVLKSLPELKNQELITLEQDKESKRWAVSLNRDSKEVIWLKRADNLKQLYESGLGKHLYDTFPGSTIILFGSYAHGEDTFNSDMDIAIIGLKERKADLSVYENILQRKINVQFFGSFKKMNDQLRNNILNGITLKGSIDL